ncbi:putative hydrolase/coenzyme F420 biosynthesis associated uncharacterized protein [Serinibacter salmoneus]|uniref:Putative hydrolase/coenzyme F420 biosynthesis associated uncharacterized protein n=2 Tax=Serinibacter salmoneus TaxID=556530 RepID=A0A2A9D2Z3_9MICO|nr:putative hydrolase/coenzyme F420 biosynthesis associated uncharacterized protein [Serinibacter salmoneus]
MRGSAIDWDRAARRAAVLLPAGPPTDLVGAATVVESLREGSRQAPGHVACVTGLQDAGERAGALPVRIVDRAGWARAATQSFAALLGDHLTGGPGLRGRLSAAVAGDQLGGALALLGPRVLGQFDPYTPGPAGAASGRLLLVAPTILAMHRRLDVDPHEFALWVCLHEQTHAVQFAAAPWLADHLRSLIAAAVAGSDEQGGAVPTSRRPGRPGRPVPSPRAATGATPRLLASMLDDAQQEDVDRAIAVMSLLEGHADVVMDEVGTGAVPSVRVIRRAFEKRRGRQRGLSALIGRLLGVEEKVRQYRDGAAFTRAVVERVGHEGLNAVWEAPEQLPSPAEILAPDRWVERVHG